MDSLGRAIQRAALEAALFGEGPLAEVFDSIFGGGKKGGGGGSGGSSFGGLIGTFIDSFDGGGFTGPGPRSGGLDGKGGFPAILHPNETVIDHTKGQFIGGGRVQVEVFVHDDGKIGAIARSEAHNVSVEVVHAGLSEFEKTLPDRFREISDDPRAR